MVGCVQAARQHDGELCASSKAGKASRKYTTCQDSKHQAPGMRTKQRDDSSSRQRQ